MRVYTFIYARHDFVSWQFQLFRHFVSDLEEFVAVNNGPIHNDIAGVCDVLGIRHVDCPPISGDPSVSHSHALNYAWQTEAAHCGEDVMFCDLDLFPVRAVDVDEETTADIAGVLQTRGRVRYPWPGALLLRTKNLPDPLTIDFRPCHFGGERCDTGGGLAAYGESHDDVRFTWWPARPVMAEHVHPSARGAFREEYGMQLINNRWLHYFSGTNWRQYPVEYEKRKTASLIAWLDALLR